MSGFASKLELLTAAFRHAAWRAAGAKRVSPTRVTYITEPNDWVIKRIGLHLQARIREPAFRIAESPRFLHNSLLHFGAVHAFCHGGWDRTHPSNRVILTIYHGDFGIDAVFDRTLRTVLARQDAIAHYVTSTSIMAARLAGWGIPRAKISLIPIGIDLAALKAARELPRARARAEFGVPEDAICIGSFQKDGSGWGEGLEPKLVKGPDIFVEAVIRIAQRKKVFCLLTGPSRGYVKKRLADAGIPFAHRQTADFGGIARAYRCLDLYIVASREEGGPMALMESMASGVPLVTTRVGMAPDIIEDGRNGRIVAVEDTEGIAEAALSILEQEGLRSEMVRNGLASAERFSYDVIAEEYAELYRRLLVP